MIALEFEPVIGLEIHAQLKTRSKLFCGCSTTFGAPANSNTCPICLGHPGVLPVTNRTAVAFAIKAALMLGCTVHERSRFARKNYFYPDLPKGYQISQFSEPLATDGHVWVRTEEGKKKLEIIRVHMEEDAGKNLHALSSGESRVDLNRCGIPLIEIVGAPDIGNAGEAGAYLRTIRAILRFLDVCDGNMEEGSFRCDANISVRVKGSDGLGTRTELKNLNSFKNVEKGLEYEIARHLEIIAEGGTVEQETRLYNPDRGTTHAMRSKEEAHDYRYFPEPDLPPLEVSREWIEDIRSALPESPGAVLERFISQYGLSLEDAIFLSGAATGSREMPDYFEMVVAQGAKPKKAANWIMVELQGALKRTGLHISDAPVQPGDLAALLKFIDDGFISGAMAKEVFGEMYSTGSPPGRIIEKKGLRQVTDTDAIAAQIEQIIAAHPDQVEEYRGGKTKVLGFFVGQVMRATQGKANPQLVNKILKEKLS